VISYIEGFNSNSIVYIFESHSSDYRSCCNGKESTLWFSLAMSSHTNMNLLSQVQRPKSAGTARADKGKGKAKAVVLSEDNFLLVCLASITLNFCPLTDHHINSSRLPRVGGLPSLLGRPPLPRRKPAPLLLLQKHQPQNLREAKRSLRSKYECFMLALYLHVL
jgi:hypothetical protein